MIIVAGGGLAGVASALRLRSAGAPVTLVAPPPPPGPFVGESLAPAARRVLATLGAADVLDSIGARRSAGHASLWEDDVLRTRDAFEDPEGGTFIVDRRTLEGALRARAVAAGVRWVRGRWSSSQVDGRRFIDATGRSAKLARAAGARRIVAARMIARVAWGVLPGADTRTLVETRPEGWWYGARCTPERVVLAVFTSPDRADLVRSERGFMAALARTRGIRARFADAHWTESRVVDASPSFLDRPCGDGWLAVGDAAQTFDPLASAGMLHALYTGMRGAEALLSGEFRAYEARLAELRAAHLRERARLYRAASQRWAGDARGAGRESA